MDKSSFMPSFRTNEEKLLFSRLFDNYSAACKNYKTVFSFFLDPASLSRCAAIFEKNLPSGLNMLISGGIEGCERQMICFTPDDEVYFPITCIEISYNKKFSKKLSHRDFLGSILALGIDRKLIGDIIVEESGAIVFVGDDMCDYIMYNLDRVGNTAVTVTKAKNVPVNMRDSGREIRVSATSLRIDVVIAVCLGLSRATAVALIDSEKVFINWRLVEKSSRLVYEDEVITVRGYGRLVISEIAGKSKKGKIVLNVVVSS